MLSKLEKLFQMVMCIMFVIVAMVWHSEGIDVLPVIPWAALCIFLCLGVFILDRMVFKEKPCRDKSNSSK
jgi:hypothetical protein